MNLFNLIMFIGGLAMLLFGMQSLSGSLCRLADGKIAHIVDEMTSSSLKGVLWGAGITSVIQSSAVMTITVVGMTNAGMIRLGRAIALIMGANIGTTLTAWILSLTGIGAGTEMVQLFRPATLAAIFAVTGVVIVIFRRSERGKLVSSAFLSLAILFFGMMTMTEISLSLVETGVLGGLLSGDANPVFYLFLGVVITAMLQSSSAAVGILQAVSVAGVVPVSIALPMLFGVEIGACTAALVSSVGATMDAKRAAASHLLFNIWGAVVFFIVFVVVGVVLHPDIYSQSISIFGVAIVHSSFNVLVMLCMVPFIRRFESFLCLILPDKEEEEDVVILENRFLFSPSFASKHSYNALLDMVSLVYENLMDALDLIYSFDNEVYNHLLDTKSLVDEYEEKLRRYLAQLSRKELSEKDGDALAAMLCSVVILKQLGQVAVDIGNESSRINTNETHLRMSEELDFVSEPLKSMVLKTFAGFERKNNDLDSLAESKATIESLCKEHREGFCSRFSAGECGGNDMILLLRYIGCMEQIARSCYELSSYINRSDFSLCENQQEIS